MRNRNQHTADVFDSSKYHLNTLLEEIDKGILKLPNFQRDWKWPIDHVKSLIESIAEGHPIGAAMFMETGGEVSFSSRSFEGTPDFAEENMSPVALVLDGQQRLTSAYQALYSQKPVAVTIKKRIKYYSFFFDMKLTINNEVAVEDSLFCIEVNKEGVPIQKINACYSDEKYLFEECFFPTNMMFNFSEWEEKFSDHWDDREKDGKRNAAITSLRDFRNRVLVAFSSCQLPVIVIKRGITAEGICRVYEKLNSKGVELDAFDLLIAQYAAKEFNLRDEWYGVDGNGGLREELNNMSRGMISGYTPKLFLQAVSMIIDINNGKTKLGTSRGSILDISLDNYLKYRRKVIGGLKEACKFMSHQGIYTSRFVPNGGVVTSLAVILASINEKQRDLSVQAKIKKWFWNVVYSNAYALGQDVAMSTDVPDVLQWVNGSELEPKTIARALLHEQYIMQKGYGSIHDGIATAIIRNKAIDFATGNTIADHQYADGQFDIHHIFPRKWCNDNGIPKDQMDSIINKTPLSFKTNRCIGSNSPSVYLKIIERECGMSEMTMNFYLETHGINPEYLRNDDFDGFYLDRLQKLIEWVENDTEKRVSRGVENIEVVNLDDFLDPGEEWPENYELRMSSRGGRCYARRDESGYVISKGSIMSDDHNQSLPFTHVSERNEMRRMGVIIVGDNGKLTLSREYRVDNLSKAAALFSGAKPSSRMWKDKNGIQIRISS